MSPPNRSAKKPAAAASGSIMPPFSAIEIAANDDLLTEILLRLPVKSLMRFKSVSKQWLSLISHPSFSLRRRPFSAPASGVFLESSNDDEYDFVNLNPNPSLAQSRPPFRSLAFDDDRSGVVIAQSCNGLLLCCNAPSPDESRRNYYVYNPTTKQYCSLPRPPPCTSSSAATAMTIFGITLAFDPSRSPGYKTVCVRNSSGNPNRFWIEIYSSESGNWRPSDLGHFTAGFDTLFDRGVFWNGSVHWISLWGPSLRFHVAEERLAEMPMPPVPDGLLGLDRSFSYFAESGDHLHFIDRKLEPGESRLRVYESERDYSGWFVKYTVDLSPVSRVFPEMVWAYESDGDSVDLPDEYSMSVACVVRGETERDSFLVMNVPGKVLRYDFESGAFCKLCDVSMLSDTDMVMEFFYEAYQYIESLACV